MNLVRKGLLPKRLLFKADLGKDSDGGFNEGREMVECAANVISSEGENGLHYPVLDIDFPAYVVPSSTPGHVHLYIEKGMPWEAYSKLLIALADAHIIQEGYLEACLARRMTFVRLPWVSKEDAPTEPVF